MNCLNPTKNWLRIILQWSLGTGCHNLWEELSDSYGLIEERSRIIQRHDKHVEKVILVLLPQSPLLWNYSLLQFNCSQSCAWFGKKLGKIVKKCKGNFSNELKFNTDFSVHTRCCFARFINFIIYSYGYVMTSFLLNCRRQAQGNKLCRYYICENIHDLIGPRKEYRNWEKEVSKKTLSMCEQVL